MRPAEPLPSGRYRVRFRYGVNAAGKPKQTSETFDTKRDTPAALRAFRERGRTCGEAFERLISLSVILVAR